MSKNEKSSSLMTVDDKTCFVHPFEADCTTNHSSNNLSKDSTLDARLIILLERETELKLQIDELVEEITNLEAITKNRNRNNGINEEDNKETKKNDLKKEIAEEICWEDFEAPEWCVPIKADVLTFEWDDFAKECQFDVILMDPPWQLATHAPTRGVAIAYQQLPDVCIEELPIPKLQKNGFLFIWVINNKYSKAFEMMKKWGYTYCDDITWVKQTVNRRMAKGHGFYLQHAKETCLMGRKGEDPPGCNHSISSDVIFSERRGQSQKPEELYEMIEELVPNGNYLEIFGRKNNLRDYWVTIGNEL
ncbi:MT-A70-domain-containing protein [Glomus cerebriforme]|uniref:mRNA m(6)A methyltransferase n=1 Tax=Glomus cerebriforme TaxID=658196 RepID=A0A397ST25_9GLOM|nr:MT-A70-domain-containing protein [Glomus cerebriforme]